jgi:uncharacterized RDD family membrane protein YckC
MDSGAPSPSGPTVPGIAKRVLAMLYESLVVFAIVFFAGLAFYGVADSPPSGNTRLAFQLYVFLVLGAYFIACWTRGGRTLPMQTWKMRVVRRDNLPIGVGRAALRYVLTWPSLLFFGVGIFWAFLDRDRQFLHDRLAGTRIVAAGDAGSGRR